MVRYEAVITALIGGVLGVVLGVVLALLVSRPLRRGFMLSIPVVHARRCCSSSRRSPACSRRSCRPAARRGSTCWRRWPTSRRGGRCGAVSAASAPTPSRRDVSSSRVSESSCRRSAAVRPVGGGADDIFDRRAASVRARRCARRARLGARPRRCTARLPRGGARRPASSSAVPASPTASRPAVTFVAPSRAASTAASAAASMSRSSASTFAVAPAERSASLADLIGDDGEAAAVLAGAGGLDRGVQRQEVDWSASSRTVATMSRSRACAP